MAKELKFIAIIPARYASTRFPGKPLAMLGSKPVIQRVYERVTSVISNAVVATDDERIYAAVESFGGKVVMTSENHKSGTDRFVYADGRQNFRRGKNGGKGRKEKLKWLKIK